MIYVFWGLICSAFIYIMENLRKSINLVSVNDDAKKSHSQPTLIDFILVLTTMIPLF